MSLIGVGQAVDVVTPEDVENYKHSYSVIIASALQEERIVYVTKRFSPDDPWEW